jgi:hypothetical protein
MGGNGRYNSDVTQTNDNANEQRDVCCVRIANDRNVSQKDRIMSRTNRNALNVSVIVPASVKGNKGKGKDVPARKGKGNASPTFGRVLSAKGEDKDVRTSVESLLQELQDAKDAKDRDAQKGIRRRLRSLGYWGGTRTRTNWIGRVPEGKRKDVVSL